jgi:hypothetical protein
MAIQSKAPNGSLGRRPAGRGAAQRDNPWHGNHRNLGNHQMLIEVEITGVTPLIQNRFHDEAAMAATNGTRATLTGDKGSPKEQAEKKLYLDGAGNPMIPQPNLFRCIIDAGSFFKAGKSKVTTQKSSLIPSCVSVQGIELPLFSSAGWRVDERPVRIPSTGGRILAYRPIFDDWRTAFAVDLDEREMSEKLFRQIVDKAGKAIGLGDFRPATKGPYGKFVVTRWEEAREQVADARAAIAKAEGGV